MWFVWYVRVMVISEDDVNVLGDGNGDGEGNVMECNDHLFSHFSLASAEAQAGRGGRISSRHRPSAPHPPSPDRAFSP